MHRALQLSVTLLGCSAVLFASAYAKPALTLASASFANGATIPERFVYNGYGCAGQNASPELHWSGEPKDTRSFALTVFDPDANNGKGWWHWVVDRIDSRKHALKEGDGTPGLQGTNDFGLQQYDGPCPPPGNAPHHYVFTLYALDTAIPSAVSGPQLLGAIRGHVLGKAVFTGVYGR